MSSTKPETIYQSVGKTPCGDSFLTIKRARGYYEYSERGGVNSIFFILYDAQTDMYALINESKPPLDESRGEPTQLTTAFGGSLDDPSKSAQDIVIIEVLEESGFVVTHDELTYFGSTMVSTQSSQTAFGYLVDVTGIHKTHEAEYDNNSNQDSVIWMSYRDILFNSDWKSIFIAAKHRSS